MVIAETVRGSLCHIITTGHSICIHSTHAQLHSTHHVIQHYLTHQPIMSVRTLPHTSQSCDHHVVTACVILMGVSVVTIGYWQHCYGQLPKEHLHTWETEFTINCHTHIGSDAHQVQCCMFLLSRFLLSRFCLEKDDEIKQCFNSGAAS